MEYTSIDVREYAEFALGHIAGSRVVPLGTLGAAAATWSRTECYRLICKSGKRAEQARQVLGAMGFTSLTVLDGGIDGWRASGQPLMMLQGRPWSMERQVRVTAGALILLTLALGYCFSPYFFLGTAIVGAGLVFAGVSDTCMMAFALGRLPWNRPARETLACRQ